MIKVCLTIKRFQAAIYHLGRSLEWSNFILMPVNEETAPRSEVGFYMVRYPFLRTAGLSILLICLAFSVHGQFYSSLTLPSQASPCVDFPVEITLTNDNGEALPPSEFQLLHSGDFSYIVGSVDGAQESDPGNTNGPSFIIPSIPACEEMSFVVYFDYVCINSDVEENFSPAWNVDGQVERGQNYPVRMFGLNLSMTDIEVYLDSLDQKFKKRYTIFNSGKVSLSNFKIFVDGQDNMQILNTNFGRLSANGDTLYFDGPALSSIGNSNDLFEPGERVIIIHEIDLNACAEPVPFKHILETTCGESICRYEVSSESDLIVSIGLPRLLVIQQQDQNASPCDTGEIYVKLTNRSNIGSFPQAKALYDLVLNGGWSIVRNNRRTEPRRDNCMIMLDASVNGSPINLLTGGFSGYGLDFTRLTMDPDGPGGLSDIDGDGRYDDLHANDTIHLRIRYTIRRSCVNVSCSGEVFESRIFRLESESRNYCDEPLETDNYLNRHNYYWSGSGGSVGGIDGVYATGDVDTLSIRLAKSTNGFLNDCGKDSAIIRIFFPPVMELPPGAIVLINGDTASYTYANRRLTIFTDTVRATINVPVELSCDPNSGGGGVQTACTFCLGSGLPRYRLRVEMDYLCEDNCLGQLPLACFQSGEFFSLCDPDAKGIVSEGKFVIDDMVMHRQTLGYTDPSKTQKVARNGDSLDLASVMTFDTFNLHIPFDIRCDANYTNLRFTLAQNSIIRFSNGQRDTTKYFNFIGDTIKFYDAETNRWSTCVNALSQEVFVRQTNGFFNSYIQDVNLNSLNCLRGRFSSPDSLIIIVTGIVRDEIRNNVQSLRIRSNLTYTQDGCSQDDNAQIIFNAYSGRPHGGSVFLEQPYRLDSNYNRFYSEFSLCGTFELNTLMDNYYYNVDTIDPFYNEYRNPYIIDEILWRIPDFFALDSLPFNYIRQSFTSNKGVGFQDTLKRPYTVSQIPGYHLVRMDLADLDHFYAIRHLFRMDLVPECYGTFNDSIFVEKRVRYHLHGRPVHYKDTLIKQFYPIFVRSIEPQIENPRQQFLYDNKSVTHFSISVPTENHQPPQYWDHHYTWLTLDLAQDRYVLDSLVEITDSMRTLVGFQLLADGRYLFELDTTKKHRDFQLYGTVENCGPDTINMTLGSKCSAYPADWSDPSEGCEAYLERRQIIIRPEIPNLITEFVDFPDSTQHAPCDTFFYRARVRNTSLGHLDNALISLDNVPGMSIIEARLEYPKGVFTVLPPPVPVGQQFTWDFDQVFDSTGFRGFFDPDLNEFHLELTYSGDCAIQDGVFISLEASGNDLCGNDVTSGRARTPALQFTKDSLIGQGDLYKVELAFEGDTLCGDIFTMKAKLTSMDDLTMVGGQRIAVFFAKELRFLPGSFNAVVPQDLALGSFKRLEAQEVIYIDVPTGIMLGDSMVFQAQFERTCIGICKPTDLALEILTPQPIGCPGSPGGSCNILLKSQVWKEDSLVIAPEYAVINAAGEIVRTGNTEEARVSFDVINYSRFSVNTTLIVDFYGDINGNGSIDPADILLESVPINSPKVENAGVVSFTATIDLPFDAPCQLMATLSTDNNPCLCQGDTLSLPPLDIQPQSGRTRDCFSNSTEVGFAPLSGYTYQWLSNGLALPDQATTIFDRQSTPLKGGISQDTLYLRSSRLGGCEAIDTFFVEWYRPELEVDQVDSIRCYGDATASAVAQLDFGEGPIDYSWDNGQNTAMASGLGQGIYTVIGRDTNSCADTISIFIDQPDSLQHQLDLTSDYNGYPVRCHGDENGWVTFNVSGGTPEYLLISDGAPQPLDTLRDLGAGWTSYRIEDKYGCWAEDSVFLDQPDPITSGTDATIAGCDEESGADAWAIAMGGVSPYTYSWSNGQIGDTIGPISEGEYTVEITDENGCISYDTVEVDRLPDPVLFVNLTDTTVDYGKTIRILASSNADSGIFIWYPSEDVSCDTCSNTFVTPTENLIIQVKVVDKYGCEAWEDISIQVSVTKRVWAPNVFTPDGNNVNDGFTLFGNPTLERIEMLAIYDRWGENVFLKEDFEPGVPSEGWDGLLNGTEMNPAVFAWVARVRFFDGETRWMSGDVTLLR